MKGAIPLAKVRSGWTERHSFDTCSKRLNVLWRISHIAGLLALLALAAAGCGTATPAQTTSSAHPEPTSGSGAATPTETVASAATPAQVTPYADPKPTSGSGAATPTETVASAATPAQVTPPPGPEPTRGAGDATPTQVAPPTDPKPVRSAGGAAPIETVLPGDGTWVLVSLDGQPLIKESFVMMSVNADRLQGYDGCNRYGLRSDDGTPVFDANGKYSAPLGTRTDTDCVEPEGVGDQAEAYFSTLMRMDRFRVSGDRLEILDNEGAARLTFVRQAPLPGDPIDLQGTGWRLLDRGVASEATMSFLEYGLVIGVMACRAYAAAYRETEGSVRFPSTSMLTYTPSCSKDARRSAGESTDFLTWATEYAVSEEGGARLLRMRSYRGKTLTFEPLSPTAKDIAGTEWTLVAFVEVRIHGFPRTTRVVQGTDVTISFDGDGFSGSAGCNSYTGQAVVEDGAIAFDVQALSHTDKVCEGLDGLMEQEERFLDLLARLERYGTYGGGLFLRTDNRVFLLFEAR